jgi:hypothetical protein
MALREPDPFKKLRKKSKKSKGTYPLATIAFYGPDTKTATKVVVGILKSEGTDPEPMRKWFSEGDVRTSAKIGEEISAFLRENKASSSVMADGVIGCPHEEGVDYPESSECPHCPFWVGRDRWSGLHK